jgi:hypothetical protein
VPDNVLENRRAEERVTSDGEVTLSFDDPAPRRFAGHLLDYSARGFRAAHAWARFENGQVVEFRHNTASGRARVMWNRIVGEAVETGFLVL